MPTPLQACCYWPQLQQFAMRSSVSQAAFETARLVSSHTPAALQLVSAYVALVQPSKVGPLMENLRTALPLRSLQHLKRVRKGPQQPLTEVLLCALRDLEQQSQQQQHPHQQQLQQSQLQQEPPAQHQQQQHTGNCALEKSQAAASQAQADTPQHQQHQQLPQGLPPCTTSVLGQIQAQVTIKQVPGNTPDNRQQWQDWVQHWPMPWRCPAGMAEQQDGVAPGQQDQAYFEQHMTAVLAASAAAGGRNVARIVDPKTGTVLAECVDASHQHPLDHAAMCAIEAVADRDRRMWPFNGFAHVGRHAEAPDAGGYIAMPTQHPVCSPRGQDGDAAAASAWEQQDVQQQQLQQGASNEQQPAGLLPPCKRHKAGSGADGAAQHAGSNGSNGVVQGSNTASALAAVAAADGNTGDSSEAAAAANGDVDWASKPYLCTGYDCFLAREPCIMCSMAMVHSRLARVVYCQADKQYGALGGKLRLHAQRSLNHHYLVYQMPLKQQ